MQSDFCVELALYFINNKSTVRKTAEKFLISKTAVHNILTKKLPKVNYSLFVDVKKIFEENKQQKHIRGGLATKLKYFNERTSKQK